MLFSSLNKNFESKKNKRIKPLDAYISTFQNNSKNKITSTNHKTGAQLEQINLLKLFTSIHGTRIYSIYTCTIILTSPGALAQACSQRSPLDQDLAKPYLLEPLLV